jgi:hypothetical protein
METDADRSDMLRALGGSDNVIVDGQRLSIALFEDEPRESIFDELRVITTAPTLRCLYSEAKRREIRARQRVEIPGATEFFYVAADPVNEDGLALIELRKE